MLHELTRWNMTSTSKWIVALTFWAYWLGAIGFRIELGHPYIREMPGLFHLADFHYIMSNMTNDHSRELSMLH